MDRFGAAYASVVQAARALITRFCFSEDPSTFLCGTWSWGVDKCVLAALLACRFIRKAFRYFYSCF
jgi:hypothetical protein